MMCKECTMDDGRYMMYGNTKDDKKMKVLTENGKSKYTIMMIRDFPEFLIGWQGMYMLGDFDGINEAKAALKSEIELRGGKYGGIIIEDNKEVWALDNKGNKK